MMRMGSKHSVKQTWFIERDFPDGRIAQHSAGIGVPGGSTWSRQQAFDYNR
jgi:hypothetical protein